MRALGVDVGTVRVGLAVSDPDGLVATPLETMDAGDAGEDLADRLQVVAESHECDTVVVGLPRGMHGRDTASTVRARKVAATLRSRGLHCTLWDERLSSAEAERVLLDAGRGRTQRRAERDQVAAVIILQGWLDSQRSPGRR